MTAQTGGVARTGACGTGGVAQLATASVCVKVTTINTGVQAASIRYSHHRPIFTLSTLKPCISIAHSTPVMTLVTVSELEKVAVWALIHTLASELYIACSAVNTVTVGGARAPITAHIA